MPVQPTSIFAIAVDGCRKGLAAVFALPRLFAGAFLIGAVFHFVLYYLTYRNGLAPLDLSGLLLVTVSLVMNMLVVAPVLIAVHRFVILAEHRDRSIWRLPRTYARFALWLILVNCYNLLANFVILMFGPDHTIVGLFILLYWIAGFVLFFRTLLLFPALALGSRYATWPNSWRDTRGHVWKMIGAGTLLFAPVMIAALGVSYYFGLAVASFIGPSTHDPNLGLLALSASGTTALNLVMASIGAVMASRFFQLYGRALISPPPAGRSHATPRSGSSSRP